MQLVVQEIDQVPEVVSDELGGKSAQQAIAESWKPHTDQPFSSYGLRYTGNRSDSVRGTLYKVDMHDALALAHWDIASPKLKDAAWRFLDHGIDLADGRRAMTFNIGLEQETDRIVTGEDYPAFLNDKETTLKVIREVMRPFLAELDSEL